MNARVVALRSTQQLRGTVGKDLVRVHVVRGAGPSLIHIDDELIAESAVEHLVCRGDDRPCHVLIEPTQIPICLGSGFLDLDRRRDELRRCRQAADGEVLHGTLGLAAVIGLRRHPHLSQGIAFDAVLGDW